MEAAKLETRPYRQGFTLIEMLVTISIIGILIACYCPLCKWLVRPPGSLNVAITSIKLALRCMAITTRVRRCRQVACNGGRPGKPEQLQAVCLVRVHPAVPRARPLYESINFDLPYDDPRNARSGSTRLSTFICPSATAPARAAR